MPSPFAEFPASARMEWRRPAANPTTLRDGTRTPTVAVVIELFAKAKRSSSRDASAEENLSLVAAGSAAFSSYVIRWAVVPAGDTWLGAGTAWTWDTSGLAPAGLVAGEQPHKLYMGSPDDLAAPKAGTIRELVISQVGPDQGTGGVGAIIRESAGDKIEGVMRTAQ